MKASRATAYDVNVVFVRGVLKRVHADAHRAFPQIHNIVQCAGVTRTGHGRWFVQITVPRLPVFNFDCRAYNATEARYKAWVAFIFKFAPVDTTAATES